MDFLASIWMAPIVLRFFPMLRLFIALQLIGLGTLLLFHAAVGAWLLGFGVLGVIAVFAWRLIHLAA